jgi:hypothetical protein
MAGIVLPPEVRVAPLTVIAYPAAAFVDAAICDVAVAVSVGENSWLKVTAPAVAEAQLTVTVAPVQKIRDSGMVPVSTIGSAVLAATLPVSIALPVAFVAT